MSIIDFHTHAFPHFLAPKALSSLSSNSGYTPLTDGTIPGLISKMDEWGISRSVVCNIATNAKQTRNVNQFAIDTNLNFGDRITSLCSVHPCSEESLEMIMEAKRQGIPGVKLHPDFMGFDFSDKIFDPILSLCEKEDLFVIVHSGFDHISPEHYHCTPLMILNRLKEYPHIKLIAAHYGSNRLYHDVLDLLIGTKVYFDTSLSYESGIPIEVAKKMILKHDDTHILFGSDCPWSNPKENIEFLEKMNLSSCLMEQILYKNGMILLK